jgi:undecaprenyl-diphosphatase
MPEFLLNFDRTLFHFINHDLGNPVFDWLMPILRNPKTWIPLYIFIILFCIWNYKKQGVAIVLFMAISAGLANFTADTLLKASFKRIRPCSDPAVSKTDVLRIACGTGYSFPSIHATDHFAMAVFISLVFCKKWKWIWIVATLWATLIAFAQVYVGVHYPVDVICGGLYGAVVGVFSYWLYKKAINSSWLAPTPVGSRFDAK